MSSETQRVARHGKPPFQRGLSWVALKPCRASTKVVHMPGEAIPENYPAHVLQYWWSNGWIGPEDSPWTAQVLEEMGLAEQRRLIAAGVQSPDPKPEPEPTADGQSEDGDIEIEELGGGWYSIRRDGEELAKKRGTDAVNEWLKGNGYDAAF